MLSRFFAEKIGVFSTTIGVFLSLNEIPNNSSLVTEVAAMVFLVVGLVLYFFGTSKSRRQRQVFF